jgi:hypothetical protein
MQAPKIKKRITPLQVVGAPPPPDTLFTTAPYAAPLTEAQKKYNQKLNNMEGFYKQHEDLLHQEALKEDAFYDALKKKKNKNVIKKSKTTNMAGKKKDDVERFVISGDKLIKKSSKKKKSTKNKVVKKKIKTVKKKKDVTGMSAMDKLRAGVLPVVVKRKNKGYTKSKKFLAFHAERRKKHADTRKKNNNWKLQTYTDVYTGRAGSAGEVKRLQNKLKWCKQWARKIEKKSKNA